MDGKGIRVGKAKEADQQTGENVYCLGEDKRTLG